MKRHWNHEHRDGCQFCWGHKGGVKGNENVIAGVVICDYCTALVRKVVDREIAARAGRDLIQEKAQ